MSQPIRGAALSLVLVLAACGDQAPHVLAPAPRAALFGADAATAQDDRIGPGVLEAIRADGEAPVVVALAATAGDAAAASTARGLAELRGAVSAQQAAVLSGVADTEIRVSRLYGAVPAFAATARSEAALHRLAADPQVRRIDLDVGGSGTLAASVPLIGADRRHREGNTGEGVVVAVFDSGVDTDHPDLAGDIRWQACFGRRTIPGVGFCPNGTDRQTGPGAAEDDAGHGTHVTGIVTSDGRVSAPGVAPDAEIVAIKVLDNCSFAGCFYGFSEIVAAMDYVITNNATLGVQVINMSLGTSALFPGACDNSTAFNMAGAAAVNTLRSMGVVTFASAGNQGSPFAMTSPACLSGVVSVGATDKLDRVAPFSNSNATTDVFAPGVSIVSLARGGGTIPASGTSMASPHAAGCAALLIEARDATSPGAIEARLKASPVRVTDPKNGLTFPRIDCSPDVNTAPTVVGLRLDPADGPYRVSAKACGGRYTVCVRFRVADVDGARDAPFRVALDWGDGTPWVPNPVPAGVPLLAPHDYAEPGTYTVVVTVTDARGATGRAEIAVQVDP